VNLNFYDKNSFTIPSPFPFPPCPITRFATVLRAMAAATSAGVALPAALRPRATARGYVCFALLRDSEPVARRLPIFHEPRVTRSCTPKAIR